MCVRVCVCVYRSEHKLRRREGWVLGFTFEQRRGSVELKAKTRRPSSPTYVPEGAVQDYLQSVVDENSPHAEVLFGRGERARARGVMQCSTLLPATPTHLRVSTTALLYVFRCKPRTTTVAYIRPFLRKCVAVLYSLLRL